MVKSIAMAALVVGLSGACGADSTSSGPSVTLHVTGTVRDSASNAPIANATVTLGRDDGLGATTLTQVHTSTNGSYSISYKLTNIVPAAQTGGACAVSASGAVRVVFLQASAHNYATAYDDSGNTPALACVNEAQVIDFALSANGQQ